jgi:tetratricopeptide (TPR) repeat protein
LCNQERFEEALECMRSGLAIQVGLGERQHAGLTLNNMGEVLLRLKRYDEALDHLERALAIQQETGDRQWQGATENTLGHTYLDLGRFEDAVEHYRRALDVLLDTALGHTPHANALCGLGAALDSLGRSEQARDVWLTAIPILDRLNDPRAADLRARLANLGQDPARDGTPVTEA